jgi:hypothetical protein
MLAGVEAEASPEITNGATAASSIGMQNLAMGAGAKTAGISGAIKALFGHYLDAELARKPNSVSTIKIGGEDDVMGSPVTPMRGWQWKALKRDEHENLGNWTPRLFPNGSTPLTETLASPGKQSLLHALGGGALGAGLGYAAGSLTGAPGTGAAVGGGLGAMAGGAYGYSGRKTKNDQIIDALRLP